MSYGIGARIEVISGGQFQGRWIAPGEQGTIVGRDISPAEQEIYKVILDKDSKEYTFAAGEIEEIAEAS